MSNAGRPKGKNNKDYNYTVRMDETTRKRLEAYCEIMNIQKSEAVRMAIETLSNMNKEDIINGNKSGQTR